MTAPKMAFVAIIGLSPELGAQVLEFLSIARTQSPRAPSAKNVSEDQIDHFRSDLTSSTTISPDLTARHVLHVAHDIAAVTSGQSSSLDAVRQQAADVLEQWQRLQASTGRSPGHPFFRPLMVRPGQKLLSQQIEWDPSLERKHWWALSDERFTPYHFHTEAPQEVVMALGGHQGFNLVNDKTNRLVLVDWDARQLMNHTVILGLLLLSQSDDSREFVENFLNLHSDTGRPMMVERLVQALRRGEQEGRIEKGRHQFFAESVSRTGSLSLLSLLANYKDLFFKLRRGEPLTSRQRPNVEWLIRPDRFKSVLKMVREGRVEEVQANLFDVGSLRVMLDRLMAGGHKVSTLYLSNAFDIHDSLVDRHQCFLKLSEVLEKISFDENGRVLWTYMMSQNREFEGGNGRLCERVGPPRIFSDPYDKYAYFDMTFAAAQNWLSPISMEDLGVSMGISEEQRAEVEAMIYYSRLGHFVSERGSWEDGKWLIGSQPVHEKRVWTSTSDSTPPEEVFARRYPTF